MRQDIGFGTVGFGMIARTHLFGIQVNRAAHPDGPRAYPRALCTRRPEMVEGMPYEAVYTNPDELIADSKVLVVDICTPNNLHVPVAAQALKAGKALYIEKPLSHNLAEAETLCALSTQMNLPNQVAFVMRFRPDVCRMKDLLEAGTIGKALHFRACFFHGSYLDPNRPASWRQNLAQSGGGAIMDLGIHLLDLVRFLLSREVSDLRAVMRTVNKKRYTDESRGAMVDNDTDEYACAQLRMEDGTVGVVECSRVSDSTIGNQFFEVFGDKGSLVLQLDVPDSVRLITPNGAGQRVVRGEAAGPYEASLLPLLPGSRQTMGPFMDAHAAAIANIARLAAGLPGFIGTPDIAEGVKAQQLVVRCLEAAQWS